VIAAAVSKAAALSKTHTTVREVADALGLDQRMISKCEARFNALTDGEWEQLFDDRQALRDDSLPKEWRDLALRFWIDPFLTDQHGQLYNFVRASERTSDEMRDPKDRKSAERWRIHWLEERIGVMYDAMLRDGKIVYGPKFHLSWPVFLDLRPFFVKDATRETCMCVYHLRWREMADGLLTYRRKLRDNKVRRLAVCGLALVCSQRQIALITSAHRSRHASAASQPTRSGCASS
jgi:hypothetical protein